MKVKEVKEVAEKKQLVIYDGIKYIVIAYVLRLLNGEWKHLIELKDLNAKSSVRTVEMAKVEVIEGEYHVG